jgi:putative DNA primase/helicase
VPAVCVSLIGNIQPARLRWYLSAVFEGGPSDDGLLQRFQILVYPDPPREWILIDRPPNRLASGIAEKVFASLANLSADEPVRMHFDPGAQELFYEWWTELENKIRDPTMAAPLIGHLAKFRSLMPSLAGLFELADRAANNGDLSEAVGINVEHARRAAAFCEYLESQAMRVYSCVVSPGLRAARELARHIAKGDLPEVFTTRYVYFKGWSGLNTPEAARSALTILEDAGWLRRNEQPPSIGGRPCESWSINPKVVAHGRK